MKKAPTLALLAAMAMPLIAAPNKTNKPSATPKPKALEAHFVISPPEFGPQSTLELTFPTPMVAKDQVGKPAAESPLVIAPALPGKFEWTSTRSGLYRPTEAPKFDSSYVFSLRAGLNDLQGQPISAGKLTDTSTEKFRIVEQYPRWFDETDITRTPSFLLEFNDTVTTESVAAGMAFKCGETNERIAVSARLANAKDFKHHYAEPMLTWQEQVTNTKVVLSDEQPRESAVIVEPAQPLNPGKDWVLDIAETVVNKAGTSKLQTGDNIKLGNVLPFTIREISAHSPFDRARYVDIDFSRSLVADKETSEEVAAEEKQKAELAAPHIKVEPAVNDAKFTIDGSTLRVSGGFELRQQYKISIAPQIVSGDGLKLAAEGEAVVVCIPNPPYVAASSFMNAQLAGGKGEFEFSAANVTQVRMRAKRMTGPELLQAIQDYQPYTAASEGDEKKRKEFKVKPFAEFPGTVVFDRTFPVNKPLDQSALTKLTWKEVLGDATAAPLFIEIEGTAMPDLEGKASIAQCLVEFTDIGLLQKDNYQSSTVLAVSLQTGKPLPGVKLTLVDADRKLVGHSETDENGQASIPGKGTAYVLAEKGSDCTALETQEGTTLVPLWHFGLNNAWQSPWDAQRKTFLFADRPLFKPGDTAHLKAYTRTLSGDDLRLDAGPVTATLLVRDPRWKVVIEKAVTFSANGSWNDDLLLPSGPAGYYNVTMKFPGSDEDSGALSLRVDDYRPNAFEVKFDLAKLSVQPDRIRVPIKANYFMGKALSQAKVTWNAYRQPELDIPQLYSAYHFGDAPSWANYGKDRDADPAEQDAEAEWDAAGELQLSDEEGSMLEMPAPPAQIAALPQRIRIEAEVTDINEQTIGGFTEFTVPGAAFMVGLRSAEYFARAGSETSIEAVALNSEGKPFTSDVPVKIKLERQGYHSIKVQTAGGGETVKNQVVLEEELNTTGTLKVVTAGSAAALSLPITPKHGGTYFITLEADDANGKHTLSRMPLFVVGGDEFPWAVEDGVTMDLQPEKTLFKPGEKATIVVKSPIAGRALVTVERNRVQRSFQTDISPAKPVIEVPLTEEDAPNVFVSVVLIRGAQDSPQPVKMPDYKIGYCELTIDSHAKDLAIEVKPERTEVRPGEAAAVSVIVNDAAGKPVSNAEVTLAAVDEGVLSLMSYETPEPSEFFHAAAPLAIRNHTNLGSILTEDAQARIRGNKGFVVGGGGIENEGNIPSRKNFLATALWTAVAVTDATGSIKTSFTAPDNLTRFRVMAIASEGADRFGNSEASVTINKPLMLEPALPRFARLDDELLVKAIVHNTTPQTGEVTVTLTLDDRATFITEDRVFVMASLNANNSKPEGKVWTKTVTLKAKETAAVSFPVKMAKVGTAKWQWQAKTAQWSDATALTDATESSFNVEHPVPANREVRYFPLAGNALPDNLIKDIHPQVMEGEGTVSLQVSTSQLIEIGDALDYVLGYPYGCVEQTTSSMIPWLALGGYNELFPGKLEPAKRKEAIQKGVNQLLSMVTDDGGLAYWSGGKEAGLFASAYGGFALLKARDIGAAVPQQATSELLAYLSKALRNLEDERDPATLVDSCFAVYTLAKGGQAEEAYQNLLYKKRESLPELGKLFLALSMCITDSPSVQIRNLLGVAPQTAAKAVNTKADSKKAVTKKKEVKKPAPPPTPRWAHWSGNRVNLALKLLACVDQGMTTEAQATVQALLQQRNARGEWGNTFTNAWTLFAMSAYERSLKNTALPLAVNATWGGQQMMLDLPKPASIARGSFVLNPTLLAQPMTARIPADRQVQARVEARSWSNLREFAGENAGYGITRTYEKLLPDGSIEGINSLRVGDMVLVKLAVTIGGGDRYLAIDDPLPAVFEAVNPEFDTANVRQNAQDEAAEPWFCDHRELRTDRALFFTDYAPGKGTFEMSYLARVVAEGDVIAPSARIEAMYEPDKHGLSATQRIKTLPSAAGGNVAGK